jgi:hypothetical protein
MINERISQDTNYAQVSKIRVYVSLDSPAAACFQYRIELNRVQVCWEGVVEVWKIPSPGLIISETDEEQGDAPTNLIVVGLALIRPDGM